MGQVFRGQSRGGRAVAVKVVHRHLLDRDPSFRSRFRREIEATKRVGGFYTAAVVDGDADADSPWYASAYIDAPTLADVVHTQGPLSEERALAVAVGLVEALQAIHDTGLVHRDLKPSNVLMCDDGPRVIDFGIVRVENPDGAPLTATATGNIIGTVGYLSPEQLDGKPPGPASDVFALGALLVYATTGRLPFPGGTDAVVIVRTLTGEPAIDAVPAMLRNTIRRCLAKVPDNRPTVPMLLDQLTAPPASPITEPTQENSADVQSGGAGSEPERGLPDTRFDGNTDSETPTLVAQAADPGEDTAGTGGFADSAQLMPSPTRLWMAGAAVGAAIIGEIVSTTELSPIAALGIGLLVTFFVTTCLRWWFAGQLLDAEHQDTPAAMKAYSVVILVGGGTPWAIAAIGWWLHGGRFDLGVFVVDLDVFAVVFLLVPAGLSMLVIALAVSLQAGFRVGFRAAFNSDPLAETVGAATTCGTIAGATLMFLLISKTGTPFLSALSIGFFVAFAVGHLVFALCFVRSTARPGERFLDERHWSRRKAN
jgi:hypothetical protein